MGKEVSRGKAHLSSTQEACQPPPPEWQTLTLADHKLGGAHIATASSVLVIGHLVRWDHWKGAGLAQSDPRHGRQFQIQTGCHVHPSPPCPSASSPWFGMPPAWALCPRGWPLAVLRNRHDDIPPPRKGAEGWRGPGGEAHLNLKTSPSVPYPLQLSMAAFRTHTSLGPTPTPCPASTWLGTWPPPIPAGSHQAPGWFPLSVLSAKAPLS